MSVRTHPPASSPPWRDEQYGTVHCRVTLLDTQRRRPLAEDVPCQKTYLVRRRTLSEDVPCQKTSLVRVDP